MINLVVENLPPAATVSQLAAFFGVFGEVERVLLGRNHVTGRAESFCFLDLAPGSRDPGQQDAIDMWGHALTFRAASSPAGWVIGR
ncbi:MAG TPA: hypothetical protein DEA08_13625 [Planctomycetes bacterium]|nr:hypothetical protein [Planctomycetota bacterium]|tara:strand:- start:139 stop:396 length:258 start_codon:yes stop_codon:yes gene_type:complete